MSLLVGSHLGPYDIVSALGAGGFGEVYKARDTRLDRTVAIKILPSADPELRARFEREAKAIAALQHPHICTLYDVGHQDGTDYLVMEHLEGETLADRLTKGPLRIDDALKTAIDIADALDAAHRAGFVHRDLKPANVMLTKSGGAKLLDFGLAKLRPAMPISGFSMATTQDAQPLTSQGSLLGTLQYMAPEQVEGKQADARSDVFAFGAVVYEMVTGKRAFEGKSQASVIAAILEREPPSLSTLQPLTSPVLDRVVRKCLAKDPDRRWQSAGDLHDELVWAAEGGGIAPAGDAPVRGGRRRAYAGWIVATAVAAASLLAVAWYRRPSPTPVRVMQFQVGPPDQMSFVSVGGVEGANGGTISPDGTRLVFVATDASGKARLWLRPLDSLAASPLAGTDDASLPFWSPDSRFIGFFVPGKVKKVEAAGGSSQTVCDLSGGGSPRGGTWSRDGVILFGRVSSGIFQVSAAGGQPKPVTTFDPETNEVQHRWPAFLPDGDHFLYLVTGLGAGAGDVYVGSMVAGGRKRLVASESNAAFASGFLLFMQEGTLLRQPFDPVRLELHGEAVPVVESVARDPVAFLGAFSLSNTGVLTYRMGGAAANQFTWIDRTGRSLETVGPPGRYQRPALSQDGRRLAFTRTDQQAAGDIWLLDLMRQTPSRFTFSPTSESNPVWSPDGSQILYSSNQDGRPAIFAKDAAGARPEHLVLTARDKAAYLIPSQVSPDGTLLLYFGGRLPDVDVFTVPLAGEPKPMPLVQTPFVEAEPQFSPDGRWVAYVTNETGRNEVYVQPFPPVGAKWQISSNGGRQPMWRRDGLELFFVNDAQQFYAVDIRVSTTFEYGTPRVLFNMRAHVADTRNSYVPSADGQRFLVNMLLDTAPSPINVVVNWTYVLKP